MGVFIKVFMVKVILFLTLPVFFGPIFYKKLQKCLSIIKSPIIVLNVKTHFLYLFHHRVETESPRTGGGSWTTH